MALLYSNYTHILLISLNMLRVRAYYHIASSTLHSATTLMHRPVHRPITTLHQLLISTSLPVACRHIPLSWIKMSCWIHTFLSATTLKASTGRPFTTLPVSTASASRFHVASSSSTDFPVLGGNHQSFIIYKCLSTTRLTM